MIYILFGFLIAYLAIVLLLRTDGKSQGNDILYSEIEGTKTNKKFLNGFFEGKEKLIKQGIPFIFVSIIACNIIFGNFLFACAFSFILFAVIYWYMQISAKKRKQEEFIKEFREVMISMSNSLKSGASLQVAISRAREEMAYMSVAKDSVLRNELDRIINEVKLGTSLDDSLEGFKDRMSVEEVDNFVNAAVITNKVGGDLSEVMTEVCDMIGDKIEIKREIESLTAGKRSESSILSIAPLVMVPLLFLIAPSYIEPMYSTVLGKILMGLAIIMLLINFVLAKKIMDIKL